MPTVLVDQKICIRCGACVHACPMKLLHRDGPDVCPEPVDKTPDLCIACGHCLAACPVSAVSVDGRNGSACDEVRVPAAADYPRLAGLIRSRRSIRNYEPRPVDRTELEELLEVVRWAPTARNLRPVRWLIVNDPAKVHELAGLVIDWLRQTERFPSIVRFWEKGIDMIHRGAPCLAVTYTGPEAIAPVVDAALAVETLELAAVAKGLGTCWAGFFMSAAAAHPPIAERLEIPAGHAIRSALMLGYPDETYRKIPPRTKLDVRWV